MKAALNDSKASSSYQLTSLILSHKRWEDAGLINGNATIGYDHSNRPKKVHSCLQVWQFGRLRLFSREEVCAKKEY
jgi:hypothetical protein